MAREVRGWFTTPTPEIGYQVGEHWYGYASNLGPARARVILTIDAPDQVPTALAEASGACGNRALSIWVDDRDRAARLGPALCASGCQISDATTHLALVGTMTGRAGPDGLVVESVDETRLTEWATVKLQCFGGSEQAPAPDQLASEVATRRSELALTDHQLATLGGERVAVLAHYTGRDQLVFNLGTRLPYRHRGIAQAMLSRWAAAGTASGCRSLIINCHEGGRPAALYRRLGFTDEIYWYQKYELTPR